MKKLHSGSKSRQNFAETESRVANGVSRKILAKDRKFQAERDRTKTKLVWMQVLLDNVETSGNFEIAGNHRDRRHFPHAVPGEAGTGNSDPGMLTKFRNQSYD